jgi:hypothetical protein
MKSLILLSAFGLLLCYQADASHQSVAVHGWLRCKDQYLGGIVSFRVKILDVYYYF